MVRLSNKGGELSKRDFKNVNFIRALSHLTFESLKT
jgi:hypothetical protein